MPPLFSFSDNGVGKATDRTPGSKPTMEQNMRNAKIPEELIKYNDIVHCKLNKLADESYELYDYIMEKDGLKAMRKIYEEGEPSLVRSDIILPFHSRQVLSFITDPRRMYECKPNVVTSYSVKVYNSQTLVNYSAFKKNPPLEERDICTFCQFRIYPEHNNRIIWSYFTHDQLNKLCPLKSRRVRCRMPIGGTIIEPLEGNYCRIKSFSCADIKHSLPSFLNSTIDKGNAVGVLHLLHGLKKIQPNTPLRLTSGNKRELTEESIIEDVLQWMPDIAESIDGLQKNVHDPLANNLEREIIQKFAPTTKNSGVTYEFGLFVSGVAFIIPSLTCCYSKFVCPVGDITWKGLMLSSFIIGMISFFDIGGKPSRQKASSNDESKPSPKKRLFGAMSQSFGFYLVILLVIPLFSPVAIRSEDILVCIIVSIAVLRSILSFMIGSSKNYGIITCRCNIDLKYLSQCVAHQQTLNTGVDILHLVVKAVSCALSETKSLNGRIVRFPLLGLQGFHRFRNIDITLGSVNMSSPTVKLKDVDKLSASDIAKIVSSKTQSRENTPKGYEAEMFSFFPDLSALSVIFNQIFSQDARRHQFNGDNDFSSCMILLCPKSEQSGLDIAVTPTYTDRIGPTLFITIGSIKFVQDGKQSRQLLPLTFVINSPECNAVDSEKFVKKIETLLQNPLVIK